MHTHISTHVSYPKILRLFNPFDLRWALKFTCFVVSTFPQTALSASTQWFPTFHRMTRQHPENAPGLVFHFKCRRAGHYWEQEVPIEKKVKITPFTTVGVQCSISATSAMDFSLYDCWDIGTKHYPCSLALGGAVKQTWCFAICVLDYLNIFVLLDFSCARNVLTHDIVYIWPVICRH